MHPDCSTAQMWCLKFKKNCCYTLARGPHPARARAHTPYKLSYPSLSVSKQNMVLHGSNNRWMLIMLMKYWHNILTHAICCDRKVPTGLHVRVRPQRKYWSVCVMNSFCMCVHLCVGCDKMPGYHWNKHLLLWITHKDTAAHTHLQHTTFACK